MDIAVDGWVYIEISKGMYGLPQSGKIAQEQLEKRLNKKGYYQSTIIPGLWTHKWRPISFTLVVDDFGVKYERKEDAEHLVSTIKADYECTVEWEGKRFIRLTLDWDYAGGEVHISMPGYIDEVLVKLDHPRPKKKQHSPFPYTAPKYGEKVQYAKDEDKSPKLDKEGQKFIQRVNGKHACTR